MILNVLEEILKSISSSDAQYILDWIDDNTNNNNDTNNETTFSKLYKIINIRPLNLNQFLKICNLLLKRMSKSVEMALSGRVLLLMAKTTPLTNRGGFNLNGLRNVNNTTIIKEYNGNNSNNNNVFGDEEDTEMDDDEEEEGEEGEMNNNDANDNGNVIPKKKIKNRIDEELHRTFWRLQNFFSVCYFYFLFHDPF